VAY
jgi:hypothetical protein